MSEVRIPLLPGRYFHIYTQSVGDENFFEVHKDYAHFILKMRDYILPVTDMIAYCMEPDQFHFIVRVKEKEIVDEYLKIKLGHERFNHLMSREDFYEKQLSRIYSNLFSAYALYYNLKYGRKGTLFKRAFMREPLDNNDYLQTVISHIHLNPVGRSFVIGPGEWRYSSYDSIANKKSSLVNVNEVIELFGGMDNFLFYHLPGHSLSQ